MKALVWYLELINKLAKCGLRFRDLKPRNTVRWIHLKVKNKEKKVLRK